MKNVHLALQGKGGVGKSFISSILAQYIRSCDQPVTVIDTDPVNSTLMGYKALEVKRLELMEENTLNQRKFDELIESILEEDSHFVVDNGASSFIPLSSYIIENDAINIITDSGKKLSIHTVITGGQAIYDTLDGFLSIVQQMPSNAQIIVWLNEFFGEIEIEKKKFEEMSVYLKNKDRVHGIVKIQQYTGSTFGQDIKLMLDKKLTFDEVANSEEFKIMSRSRLAKVKNSIFEQLTAIDIL